jgi:membrane protein YqaA with SNARE-associated domain
VAFVVALENSMPFYQALVFASSGNILAIIVNYWFGYWVYNKTKDRLNSSKIGRKALKYGTRYGSYSLFFSWLPIIGDPLTLVAGVIRINFIWFVVIAGSLRVARYCFLAYII